ncbi:MAG: type II toxin-antitoxin system RelE/ParE family toxin [Candidatus Micrarchaeota archaeon]
MWRVFYTKKADAQLISLDRKISESIYKKIRQAKQNPHHYFVKLVSFPYYKLRVGDYRVIADLQEEVQIIAIIKIGHRKKVYREI